MDYVDAKEYEKNPVLDESVDSNNELKSFLVDYVGSKLDPDDKNVTVEMIVETMASEFPEFVLALAEENWVRGYQQALDDVETGKNISETESNDEQKKSCKLCEN